MKLNKHILAMILCAALLVPLAACGNTAPTGGSETRTGQANGYGGVVTATVTVTDGKVTDVRLTGPDETPALGGAALEPMATAIKEKGGTDGVDTVSGATVTSKACIDAVNNALDPEKFPYTPKEEKPVETPEATTASDLYQGFGAVSVGRVGPGKDDKDVQVYSYTTALVNAAFDGDGKILALNIDAMETATPNYDGDHMPHFAGFPGMGGYNYDENHDGTVDSVSADTDEQFLADLAAWQTKRERGETYVLGSGTFATEMDAFQRLFVGMTVSEVEAWFNNYTDVNGRPLKTENKDENDQKKYDALSDEDKDMLADVVSSATISLKDPHGDFVSALKKAYDNRVPVATPASIKGIGLGAASNGRVGPGKDDKDVQVYSYTSVYASTLFDADGKIASLIIDALEVATPNYDGDGMPHFSGYPGQTPYNLDADHDGKVDGVASNTDDTFLTEVASWQTKRERGDGYVLASGTFATEADAFQKLFVGMTVDEVQAWFDKYTDVNGRPLKAENKDESDQKKYDALSDEDKAMLADVVSSATISIKDAHGDILAAIKNSLTYKQDADITVK
jgi:hypothetical protein